MVEEKAPSAETPEVAFLRECGEALYGSAWQTDLARELSRLRGASGARPVDSATVRRWLRGAYKPQPWVWYLIGALLRERIQRQTGLHEELAMQSFWQKL